GLHPELKTSIIDEKDGFPCLQPYEELLLDRRALLLVRGCEELEVHAGVGEHDLKRFSVFGAPWGFGVRNKKVLEAEWHFNSTPFPAPLQISAGQAPALAGLGRLPQLCRYASPGQLSDIAINLSRASP
ncbi:hypothetical protein NQZ68_028424, partial [Dissostichus eleginoides]